MSQFIKVSEDRVELGATTFEATQQAIYELKLMQKLYEERIEEITQEVKTIENKLAARTPSSGYDDWVATSLRLFSDGVQIEPKQEMELQIRILTTEQDQNQPILDNLSLLILQLEAQVRYSQRKPFFS